MVWAWERVSLSDCRKGPLSLFPFFPFSRFPFSLFPFSFFLFPFFFIIIFFYFLLSFSRSQVNAREGVCEPGSSLTNGEIGVEWALTFQQRG